MSTCPRLIQHDSLPVLENEEVEDESDEETNKEADTEAGDRRKRVLVDSDEEE